MTIRKWARRAMSVATVVAVGAGISVPGPGAGQAVAGPPPTADVAVTGKVGVTDAYQNPSLATDPTNSRRLAVAYFEGHALNRCYLGLSNDGGTTWDTRLLLGEGGQYPLPNPATTWCLNPVVAFGPDATLYYVAQAALPNGRVGDQVKLYASTDGGLTFRGPTTADPGETMRGYWPSVAVDQRRGRVYVAWSRHPGPPVPGRVLVSFSDDKGATLSPPVLASPPEEMFPAAPQIAVGPDGALYVVYGSEIDNVVHTTVSVDGGTSFAPSVEIIELAPVRTFGAGPPVTNRLTASFGPRYMAIVAGSQPGRAALSFWDVSGPGGLGRVSVTSTADGGRTWSLPRPVGTPPGREGDHQINSFMSAAPNGRLDVAYYVRRGAEGPQDVYVTSSSDHGATFLAARKLNQVTSSSTIGPVGFFTDNIRIGDFLGVTSLDSGTRVAWVDTRRGTPDDGHQDIFFATTVPPSTGYRLVAADGGVFAFGDAGFLGSTGAVGLNKPMVASAATPSGKGYWLVGADGGVFAFGDAGFLGSVPAAAGLPPVVAMAAAPTGKGYWLATGTGAVSAFGDAPVLAPPGALALNRPITAIAATPTGKGYWLMAADGGIFAFGDARYLGSTGALRLNKPITATAATPTGKGYWLVAADGGVFAFGDARYLGSTGALRLNKPIVATAATPTGKGYWLVAADGGVFAFGDAAYFGSTGAAALNRPVVSVAGM